MNTNIISTKEYREWLGKIKFMIQSARTRAAFALSGEMIRLYWDIGNELKEKVDNAKWGAKVIDQLARDIKTEFPNVDGFGRSSLYSMKKFYSFYSTANIDSQTMHLLASNLLDIHSKGLTQAVVGLLPEGSNRDSNDDDKGSIVQQAVGLLSGDTKKSTHEDDKVRLVQQAVGLIPWGHNVTVINKIKDVSKALWYVNKSVEQGWSRDILLNQIEYDLYKREVTVNKITNYKDTLPANIAKQAENIVKDPFVFDFINLAKEAKERDIENQLVNNMSKFLIELGKGFAYVGQQYPITVSHKDYRIDLLFYHLKLHSYVVIELKTGDYKPEYTGKLNFYLSVVDDKIKGENDNPSIGLIICKSKDDVIAKYSLENISKPIGISKYIFGKEVPSKLRSKLPTIKEIEEKLSKN